jgi:hypothetical protein
VPVSQGKRGLDIPVCRPQWRIANGTGGERFPEKRTDLCGTTMALKGSFPRSNDMKETDMTKLFASALALTIGTTGAWAANETSGDTANSSSMMETTDTAAADLSNPATLIRTRDITGGNIYTTNAANDEGWSFNNMYQEVGADWNDIGEIEDIVLDHNGQMIGIVAEIGGFLDIADKHVMIPVSDVSLVAVDDRSYAIVTKYNEEQLEDMQSVDEGFWN